MQALEYIQKYVPSKHVERELPVPGQDAAKFQDKEYVMTLIGEDQLTVSRIHGVLNTYRTEVINQTILHRWECAT